MKKILFRKLLTDCLLFFLIALISASIIIWVFQAVNYLDIMVESSCEKVCERLCRSLVNFFVYFKFITIDSIDELNQQIVPEYHKQINMLD